MNNIWQDYNYNNYYWSWIKLRWLKPLNLDEQAITTDVSDWRLTLYVEPYSNFDTNVDISKCCTGSERACWLIFGSFAWNCFMLTLRENRNLLYSLCFFYCERTVKFIVTDIVERVFYHRLLLDIIVYRVNVWFVEKLIVGSYHHCERLLLLIWKGRVWLSRSSRFSIIESRV